MAIVYKFFNFNFFIFKYKFLCCHPRRLFYIKIHLNVVCKVGSPLQEDFQYIVFSTCLFRIRSRLNTEYKNKMRILDENRKSNLLKSQRIWLKSRKTKCDFEYKNAEGGQRAEIYIIDCYAQETQNESIFYQAISN